jgi:hypothetical protein
VHPSDNEKATMTDEHQPPPQTRRPRLDRQISTTVISWQIAVVLLLAVILLLYFLLRGHGISLPPTLGNLQLYREITGDEARRTVADLHGKEIGSGDNLIGMYGSAAGSATLYASVFGGEEEAAQMYSKMASQVGQAGTGFGVCSTRMIEGKIVSMCVGMGQVHYFFARGRVVYWLAADIEKGEELVKALMVFADQQIQ